MAASLTSGPHSDGLHMAAIDSCKPQPFRLATLPDSSIVKLSQYIRVAFVLSSHPTKNNLENVQCRLMEQLTFHSTSGLVRCAIAKTVVDTALPGNQDGWSRVGMRILPGCTTIMVLQHRLCCHPLLLPINQATRCQHTASRITTDLKPRCLEKD